MLVRVLWVAQGALFIAGWVGPWRDAPERGTNGRVPLPVRMALSLSLMAAAWLIWSGSPDRGYCRWVAWGMSAAFVGDLIMARLIPLPNRLVGGMAAFGLAHALYINAYVQTMHAGGAALPNNGLYIGFSVYGLVTLGGWWFFIRNPGKDSLVNIGALAYGSWISVMASCALALATALGGAWWLAALGGSIFIVSDTLIGITEIRGVRMTNANDWIWLTYVTGQMGIIYAGWV
jgi:uncharacterized membrane protein YhhN